MKAKIQSFQINLIAEKEGGYTVVVPQLPGCVSYGRTIEETQEAAKEAIKLHLANLKAHKRDYIKSVFSTVVQVSTSYA